MRVIGIDPGLRNLGWGVIDTDGNRMSHVANGIIHGTDKAAGAGKRSAAGSVMGTNTGLAARLLALYEGLSAVVARFAPDAAAIEQTFVNFFNDRLKVQTEGTDMAVGVWQDGRIGTFRGIRNGQRGYGSTVFGTKGIVPGGGFDGYEPLIVEIVRFFKTGKPPVTAEETLEIFAFMEAADESKRRGGSPVTLDSVMKQATLKQ